MTLTWPDTLPKPTRNSWQVQLMDARRKTQPDQGPPSYRRKFSSVPKMVSLSVVLDRSQRAIFDHFYEQECGHGVHLFEMIDPSTDGWKLLTTDGQQLLTSDGTPISLTSTWLCRFGEPVPVETIHSQVRFTKAFNIVVMP